MNKLVTLRPNVASGSWEGLGRVALRREIIDPQTNQRGSKNGSTAVPARVQIAHANLV